VPELPEVEIAARNLRRWSTGRRVTRIEVDPAARRIFRPETPRSFTGALEGARVSEVSRIGKHLLVTLRQGRALVGLHAHLGMTGKWVRRAQGEPAPSHSRARLLLDDGATLHFRDPRLFGRLRVVPGAAFSEVPELAALGPDPLTDGIDAQRLGAALARSRRSVKVLLLDQALLAGVGNIYASEALFRARVDPRRPGRSIQPSEARRIAPAILAVMRETLDREDGPEPTYVEEPGAENPFQVYGREGERCPRCRKGTIARAVLGQRSSFFCPACQR
jgi:formamidopyrimidine-DNA glycosylase